MYLNNLNISTNNINLSNSELDSIKHLCINSYYYKNYNIEVISIYFNIITNKNKKNYFSQLDVNFIEYEIIFLCKIFNKEKTFYGTQILYKKKYPIEFENLNKNEIYVPILTFDYNYNTDLYPIYIDNIRIKNGMYTNEEIIKIRMILNYYNIPNELIFIIEEYFLKSRFYSKSNLTVTTHKNNSNLVYLTDYYYSSNDNLIIAVDNSKVLNE